MTDRQYFDPETETLSREAIDGLQAQLLMELVPIAYERSGLVRRIWDAAGITPRDIRSVDDFRERVPFTSKDEVRAYRDDTGDPYGGIVCVDPADLTSIGSTSGTTGDATLVPEQWGDWAPYSIDAARSWWGMGVRPGDYGFGLWTFRTPAYYEGLQMCGAIPILFSPFTLDWNRVIDRCHRYEAALLWLGAADIIPFSRLADHRDLRTELASVKAVKYAGAPLSPRMHQRMTEEWGLDVFVGTAAGDCGLSFECTAHDGCHIWEDKVFVEHIDPKGPGPAASDDIGELVVTSLGNTFAPLVRYRSDDLVRITREPCSCGRNHVRQWTVGRKGDEMVIQGRTLVPQDVQVVIESIAATEDGVFQIIRPTPDLDALRLRVGYRETSVPTAAGVRSLLEEVKTTVLERLGVEPEVELVPDSTLLGHGHKVPRMVKA